MEEELLTVQVFTPGSDISIGFRPSQIIWGRTGNDVLLGYQPLAIDPANVQFDVLLGDLAVEDSERREGSDTFILGDWVRPYYTSQTPNSLFNLASNGLGLTDLAVVTDFDTDFDTIELYGTDSNYQLLETELLNFGLGTALIFTDGLTVDPVGFVVGASDLSLSADYFEFQGSAPPSVVAIPDAQQLGTVAYDIPLSISADPDGDVYIAGGTNGSLAADNAGLRDNFVVKYDDEGNELFSQQFGTSDFDTIYGIDTDNEGNYYVTGVTGGDLAGDKQATDLDTFVAKYDGEGNQAWIRQIGQNVVFNAFNIAVDKEIGDVFISGADVQETLEDNTFIIKYDTDGNQQWVVEEGTEGLLSFDESYGLTVADSGSVYTTGWTSEELDDSNEGVSNAGLYDNWLAKYDNETGEAEWVRQYGTPDYEWAWDVQTDSSESVYTTGWTMGDLAGENAGSADAYLTKFDQQGELLWAEQFGDAGDDIAYSLYIDQSDSIFVAGYTDGDLDGENAGSYDAWVAKYNQSGDQDWITQFGTSDRDELYGIVSDDLGNLYATGVTQGSLGDLNEGSFDGWTAKFSADSGELLDFGGEEEDIEDVLTDFDFGEISNEILNGVLNETLDETLDEALDGTLDETLETAIADTLTGTEVLTQTLGLGSDTFTTELLDETDSILVGNPNDPTLITSEDTDIPASAEVNLDFTGLANDLISSLGFSDNAISFDNELLTSTETAIGNQLNSIINDFVAG